MPSVIDLADLKGIQGEPGYNATGAAEDDAAIAAFILESAGGTATKAALGKVAHVVFTPQMFGAVGDGVANDTVAVQAAVDAALATHVASSASAVFSGKNPEVFFPMGTYLVDQIAVNGSVILRGCGGAIYFASTLKQRTAGQSILMFGSDTDGQTNASVVEGLTFKSASGTSSPTVAQIKTTPDVAFASSFYIRNCWFQTPERYAIWFTQGGDLEISGCTFDVSAYGFIKLGVFTAAASIVNSSKITRNTFYSATTNCIELSNARGIVITGNRDVQSGGGGGIDGSNAYFIQANNVAGTSVARFLASGNHMEGGAGFATLSTNSASSSTEAQAAAITGNELHNQKNEVLRITDGGIYYGLTFVGNAVKSNAVYANGAAFRAPSTGVQASVISHNSVMAGSATALLFSMSDARVSNNIFNSNPNISFTANNNFASPAANGA